MEKSMKKCSDKLYSGSSGIYGKDVYQMLSYPYALEFAIVDF